MVYYFPFGLNLLSIKGKKIKPTPMPNKIPFPLSEMLKNCVIIVDPARKKSPIGIKMKYLPKFCFIDLV